MNPLKLVRPCYRSRRTNHELDKKCLRINSAPLMLEGHFVQFGREYCEKVRHPRLKPYIQRREQFQTHPRRLALERKSDQNLSRRSVGVPSLPIPENLLSELANEGC